MLTPALAHQFRSATRERGRDYVRARRVSISSDGPLATAQVRGSRGSWYTVHVTALDHRGTPTVAACCECPHFEGGNWCKHVWAVLLVLDGLGWTPPRSAPPQSARLPLRRLGDYPGHELADDLDDALDEDFLDDDTFDEDGLDDERDALEPWARRGSDRTPLRRGPEPPAAPRGAPPRSPTWHDRIARLGQRGIDGALAGSVSTRRDSPLLYLIDIEAVRRLQAVELRFARRSTRRDGTPGALMPAALCFDEMSGARDENERMVLAQLITLAQAAPALRQGGYGYSSYENDPRRVRVTSVTVPMALLDPMLPRLAETGRLSWVPAGISAWGKEATCAPQPLRFAEGPAWELRCELVRASAESLELRGRLVRGEEELRLDAVDLALDGGFVIVGEVLAPARLEGRIPAFAALREGPIEIPESELDAAIERLCALPEAPAIDFGPDLGWCRGSTTPLPRLRFAEIEAPRRQVDAVLHFGYGAAWVEWDEPAALLLDRAARCVFARDPDAEMRFVEALVALGVQPRLDDSGFTVPTAAFEPLAADLLAKGWILEVAGAPLRRAGVSRANVRSGIDFFELAGGVEFGSETVSYPALLAALQKGSRFVRLGDGSRGLLPSAWIARSADLARLGEIEGDALRFGRAQIGFLAELLDAQDEARTDRRFAELRRKIAGFTGIEPADAPAGFHGTLRGYQRDGLGWLHFVREFGLNGCLADDMGLGKTVQVLALLASRVRRRGARRTSLVVAPKSVVDGWVSEAARFAPALRVLRLEGPQRAALRARIGEHDLVVTTYGTMLRDVRYLAAQRFDYAILDEAQAIKNAASQTARAAKLLRADHRLTLTGTPVENHLGELASQLEFLSPGLLGRVSAFSALARGRSDGEGTAVLARALRPFLLRRTKEQVLADLPPKTEQILHCELAGRQRRDYDELRRHYQASLAKRIAADGLARSKIHVLEALLRLRQAACHPALIDASRGGEPCAKLEILLERLAELGAEGHKALVFSQFTAFLAQVKRLLDERGIACAYLDGRTRDRRERIERFASDPDCPVFLISLKAGGTGLNLVAADYVFLLDPWWNPAVEAQAIDRTHRIGQTRPVFAYRIVARDTVEERILELQERKRALAAGIFDSAESLVASLDAEELRALLA